MVGDRQRDKLILTAEVKDCGGLINNIQKGLRLSGASIFCGMCYNVWNLILRNDPVLIKGEHIQLRELTGSRAEEETTKSELINHWTIFFGI